MTFVDPSRLESVRAPLAVARGLPNAFYTDPAMLAEERDRLFFAGWAGIGFAGDIPAPGDAMPVRLLGMPLLAVRSSDGAVRVYQNTCRHRGMILVSERTRIRGAIRCPYHSWCYRVEDGGLRTTPHLGGPGRNVHPDVNREELGLHRIRSHVWRDVIFVNVSGDAPPFEEHAAEAIARWSAFEAPLHPGGPEDGFTLDVACNWKLAVENYCESYHLPWVHPGLNSYSRLEDHYHIESEGFAGQGTRVYRPMLSEDGRRFPDFPGLGPEWDAAAEYIALFPNVLLGVHRDHGFAIVLEPDGPERTREHVSIRYADPGVAGASWEEMRRRNAAMWRGVFEEDVFVVEGMQAGRHGVHFDGGRFSPAMDGPTHAFHRWVADRFLAA